ncbi:MAG: hypothetical protein HY647_09760 [Acidobacteria bacterium]|nr:hypothetical protein [Acidobacteriota bacterium]
MKFLAHLMALAVLVVVLVSPALAQPSIAQNGVLNGASYALPGLPNAGIAQGSIFIIFGQRLGPATLVKVSSFPLPTSPPGLAGTSVKVAVGGTTVDAIMLYTSAGQVAVVLPSSTPLGSGTLTVTYNGQTSGAVPITVVRNSFGIFALNQAGSGPGVIQNYNSATDAPFNTVTEAARPGQVAILWGTGLGPVIGNEAVGPLPGDLTSVSARVLVGGREAQLQYRGRSGCCVGVDQVNFVVPQGVEGCHVPVAIQIGNVVSNYASMAISSSGKVCSDPTGFTAAELAAAQQRGSFRLGTIGLDRFVFQFAEPGSPPMEFKLDNGGAEFENFTFSQLTQSQGFLFSKPVGTCTVLMVRGDGEIDDPVSGTPLEAGPAINITGPLGAKQLTRQNPGHYSAELGGGFDPFGGGGPPYLEPGSYSLNNGSGGIGTNAVGAFQFTHTVPTNLVWTNQSSITTVNRAQGVEVTWSGGDPNGSVIIYGASEDPTGEVGAVFLCVERVSAGRFTVPPAVLLSLPASGSEESFLLVGSSTNPTRFTATGLDAGYMVSIVLNGKQVNYQ